MARTTICVLVVLMTTVMTCIFAVNVREKGKVNAMRKIKMAFMKLNGLVNSPGKPKGTPFTRLISKPLPNHRVAIVGAGLAGLHMAYLLKKNNITNVVVLEKDSRFGGKLMSVKHKGVVHELGACYTSPDYIQNVYELARELGIHGFVPLPTSTVWLDGLSNPILASKYVLVEVMKLTGDKSPLDALKNIIDATHRYTMLHRRLFGKYNGDLMPKPSKQVHIELNQTMLSFLTKHRMLALTPILISFHTMQGYGHLDRISALYGVMWNTPVFLTAAISRALQVSNGGCEMFRDGFMQLTDKLATRADVRLNVEIENVQRDQVGGITIKFNNASHSNVYENFDYLIWAADAREAIKVFDSTTSMEKSFSRQKNTWFTTRLYDSTEQCRSLTPIEYWLDNVKYKRQNSIWARRNSEFVMTGQRCNATNTDSMDLSFVSYQMGDLNPLGSFNLDTKFQQFHNDISAQDVQIIKERSWNYFSRFSVKDMADGMLWKIAERQGEKNTWFIGASVSFESAKSVVSYNKLMMERMMM